MLNSTIILAHDNNDIFWAINYYQTHLNEKIIILTSNLINQLILKKYKLPYLKLYDVEDFDENKLDAPYINAQNNIYKSSLITIDFLEKETKYLGLNIYEINLFQLLRDNLFFIYCDIFHAYKTYKNIINKWQPKKIYVPLSTQEKYITGSGDDFFSLACYIKYYFRDSSTKIINYDVPNNKIASIDDIIILIKQKTPLIKYFIQKLYYSVKFQVDNQGSNHLKNVDVLMETGGIITSYYYKLYKLLSSIFNLKLVTYKLQLYQQIPLIKRKIPFFLFESLWNNEMITEFNNQKKNLIKKIVKLNTITLKSDSLLYCQSLKKAILRQTYLFFQKNLDQTIKKVIVNKEILERFQPKLVINTHDPSPTGLSLVLPAKQLRIPTLLLLHGIPMGKYHPKISSDFIVAWGKSTRDFFLKNLNFDRKALSMSGFPLFDEYQKKLIKLNKNKLKFLCLSKPLNLGVVLTNYHPNNSYQSKFFHELLSSLGKLNIKLTSNYRFHEGFTINGIEKLGKEYGIKITNKSLQNLDEFINSNDIIICWDTTAILWAMLYQKPLFYTCPIWGSGLLPLQKYKAAWIPKNAQDLVKKINEFIDNPYIYRELLPGQKKFLEDFAGPLDGKSSERLVKIIDILIEKHDPKKK